MQEILTFLPLAVVIGLVLSGVRHEAFEDILRGAARFFIYLCVGIVVFSAVLQLSLQVPALFYTLLFAILALLGYYTLKEVLSWIAGGSKAGKA